MFGASGPVKLVGGLLLATALLDRLGLASASFYLLLVGVPFTAAASLEAFGRTIDAATNGESGLGRFHGILSALLVATIVLGTAIRAPAVGAGNVPPPASAALVLGFLLLAAQALAALAFPARR
jgi:hypothetical protein